MKKDIEWLKEALEERIDTMAKFEDVSYSIGIKAVYQHTLLLINQLDEPEVLSDKWIDDNSVYASSDGITEEYVHVDDLQNLLVPKQEELEVKIQELIEAYKQEEDAYSNPENGWISGFIEDLKNLVEKEQKYYVILEENSYGAMGLGIDREGRLTFTATHDKWCLPKLTEQEIKDYDERFWPFAVKVEELEE